MNALQKSLTSNCLNWAALFCLMVPIQKASAVDGKQVNAFIVTAQWRAGGLNWGKACPDCWSGWVGNIEFVTVLNGAVTKVDTIWNRTQGYGQYPSFDAEAKRVAFYRWAKGTVGNTSVTTNGGKYTVSIMNRDGSNVKNLVTLRAEPFSEMALNWPVGDWVYYINPQAGNGGRSTEVRKVNVNTLQDLQVYPFTTNTCYLRRFELTMDASRVGVQTYGVTGDLNWNGIMAFPSMSSEIVHFAGCNGSVSASGTYGSSYFAGNHTEAMLDKIGASKINLCLPLYDKTVQYPTYNTDWPNRGNVNDWITNRPSFNGSVLDGAMSCNCMRWAANSDKWLLQMASHYGLGDNEGSGSNCIAANWIDKAAFFVSNNAKLPLDNQTGIIYHGNSTGDMWVDGGAANAGKWEDTMGVWHPVPGFVATGILKPASISSDRSNITIADVGASVRVMLPEGITGTVSVIDSKGRMVLRQLVTGSAMLGNKALQAGVYQVVITSGKEVFCRSVMLSH